MSMTDEFFSGALNTEPPVSIDFSGEIPKVVIHDPEDPQAFEIVTAMLAAMDALTSGADDVTDEMVAKAAIVARTIIDRASAALDRGAKQVGIMVDFSDDDPKAK